MRQLLSGLELLSPRRRLGRRDDQALAVGTDIQRRPRLNSEGRGWGDQLPAPGCFRASSASSACSLRISNVSPMGIRYEGALERRHFGLRRALTLTRARRGGQRSGRLSIPPAAACMGSTRILVSSFNLRGRRQRRSTQNLTVIGVSGNGILKTLLRHLIF